MGALPPGVGSAGARWLLIAREHAASTERLIPRVQELAALETEADDAVFELYELPAAMRALVESDY